uniref:Uncharacterized protein n=1 Tax=Janibacter limosus TaxID=53458 RepID=A0AC61U6A2_9MICO|nr:hypothetical protein [Janibacter limosus]
MTTDGSVPDTRYPEPTPGEAPEAVQVPEELLALAGADEARGVRTEVVTVAIDLDAAPEGASDAYLRLHLLSHRLAAPNSINLDGLFGQLSNVVWTNHGPCPVEGFEATRARLRARGPVRVTSIDKFPRLTDYVTPSGVRIGDADRVRLGAHLASGTTVMHEGFVNFNAGTPGTSMVEGRISRGRRRRRRLRHRWRRVDDGHPLRRRHAARLDRRALPRRRRGRRGHRAGRRLRRRGGPLRDRRDQGHPARQHGRQGRRALRPQRPALRPQLGHGHRRGPRPHR